MGAAQVIRGGTVDAGSRRLRWVLVPSLVVAGLGLASIPAGGQPKGRPNFVVLVSDDQRWDQLSSAENPLIPELRTPHMDRIAREGVSFRNAFITTPICAVSRASIMTGRYVSTHGMNHFKTPVAPDVLAKSYPALLKAHGYTTGVLGKWGMGVEGTQEVFDVFNAWMEQGGYFHDTEQGPIHNSEWLARETHKFLETRPKDKPFCLTVCFKAPHHPYQPDERDRELFEQVVIPRRATDTPAAYAAIKSEMMEKSLNRWCYFDERKDQATREMFEKNFLRCVVSLDRAVGMILKSLEELDLEKDTVVVFLSDNGYLWGEHGLGGKWLLYEESIRVPILFRIPGLDSIAVGSRIEGMALNIDIAPTILDIAGIPVPDEMDGKSVYPLIQGREKSVRDDFFMEHVGVIKVRHPIPDSMGVRTRDWKYIRYVNVEPEIEELYHIGDDPFETRNLIDDPKHREIRDRLRKRYEEYVKTLGN